MYQRDLFPEKKPIDPLPRVTAVIAPPSYTSGKISINFCFHEFSIFLSLHPYPLISWIALSVRDLPLKDLKYLFDKAKGFEGSYSPLGP